jgi:Flp pilus assembly protein TadD
LLFTVAQQRATLITEGQSFAAEGKFAEAVRSLEEAEALRQGDDVRRLRAAALLAAGDFAAAWAAYTELASRATEARA